MKEVVFEREWSSDPYEKALAAVPELQAIEHVVRALVEMAPKNKPLHVTDIWLDIIKPLVTPFIGWGRGDPLEQAEDSQKAMCYDLATMMEEFPDERPEAKTETEKWLRSSEAFDVVTDRWLSMLDKKEEIIIECVRIGRQLVFECPYCWTYGGVHGACDVASDFYKKRPKKAKPKKHYHGASGPNFGDGDGPRAAHCFIGSPLRETHYSIKEVKPDAPR